MPPLLTLLRSDSSAVDKLEIGQIVALCGNGRLTDNSTCSQEFREYLRVANSKNLFRYADSCLSEQIDKGGQVLQDIVNELGRRLDYTVENGLYQGKVNAIGNDGLWIDPKGNALVIEVKTTDAYRINLDVIARYREQLVGESKVGANSSVLLVVGRQDTGDLEAQVRGSKHAWIVRIISIDSLKQLVELREKSEIAAVEKIHELLTPFEYTRLDRMISIAFTVAEDATGEEDIAPEPQETENIGLKQQHTSQEILESLRSSILEALSSRYSPLVKKSRALFWSADQNVRATVTLSKEYKDRGFWYAYHDYWDDFLKEAKTGLYVLGCVGRQQAYVIPYSWIHSRLSSLNTTERDGHIYYHVLLYPEQDGELFLWSTNGPRESLRPFRLDLKPSNAAAAVR